MARFKKRLWSIPLALALMVSVNVASVAAYELAPSGEMGSGAIGDGIMYMCFGVHTGEQLYVHRQHILNYVNDTWGYYGNLEFRDNGICNNDGSSLKLRWQYDYDGCPAGEWLGKVQTYIWDWSSVDIWFNAECHYAGKFDYTSNGPFGGWGMNTTDSQYPFSEIVAHEIGHALGIQHSSNTYSIMLQFSDSPNRCGRGASQGLSRDDTDALKDEYDFKYTWTHGILNAPTVPTCWG